MSFLLYIFFSIITSFFFQQWKYYNTSIYNLRVRKQVGPDRYIKIGLQLYQVDQKSYLLDFRMFDLMNEDQNKDASVIKSPTTSLPDSKDINHHSIMEFFELCAGLIGSLAR